MTTRASDLSSRRGVLAGGNWIVDHVKMIEAWPAQDTLVSILSQTSSNGGSPYNILKNLSLLGAAFPLEAAGLVGEDADGQTILEDCRAHRIDLAQLKTTREAATSYTDVMTVRGTGRRTFFHQRGANALLDETHFDFSRTSARHFHLGYLLLLDRLDEVDAGGTQAARVLARARGAGLTTSIDCVSEASDRFSRVILPALPEVDVLFANDFEAERLTGLTLRNDHGFAAAAVEEAARRLLDHGVRAWVVIHFPEAVYACSPGGKGLWQPSVNVAASDIAGAAGAGDALASGVLLGYHEGRPMSESLRLGVCAAAMSLFHPTCSGGIQRADACLATGARLGYRSLPV